MFITLPINKKLPNEIRLNYKIPELKEIGISKNAGNYVCNYLIFTIEIYLRYKNLDTEFYFIHIPLELTKKEEKELVKFILT